jgi:hypothetical protein
MAAWWVKIYLRQNYFAIRSVCENRWQIKLTGFSAESIVMSDPIDYGLWTTDLIVACGGGHRLQVSLPKDSESIVGVCGCARTHLASVGLWSALEKSLETKLDGKEFSVSDLVSMRSKSKTTSGIVSAARSVVFK